MATDTSSTNAPDALPRWSAAFLTSLSTSGSELNSPNPSFNIPSLRCEISPDNYKIKSSTIFKTKKRAECIVEFHKHAGIIKNTREVWRCTSRRRALLALLECSQKPPSAYITQQCPRNRVFYFFYKMYRELRALVPMRLAACIISQKCTRVT